MKESVNITRRELQQMVMESMYHYLVQEDMEKPVLNILWLDDKREPNKYFGKKSNTGAFVRNYGYYHNNIFNKYTPNYIWVKNMKEFQDYIMKNGIPDFISFDHDLTLNKNNPEPSGMDVAKWLVQYCKETGQKMPPCFVHSANQSKTPEMNTILGIND